MAKKNKKLTRQEERRFAEFALEEAKLGNPGDLIGRLADLIGNCEGLTHGEFIFVIEALQATAGKRGAKYRREEWQWLITETVARLTKESGGKQEAAVEEVTQQLGMSRRAVFNALKQHEWFKRSRAKALAQGYEDAFCEECFSYAMRREGTAMRCDACGCSSEEVLF